MWPRVPRGCSGALLLLALVALLSRAWSPRTIGRQTPPHPTTTLRPHQTPFRFSPPVERVALIDPTAAREAIQAPVPPSMPPPPVEDLEGQEKIVHVWSKAAIGDYLWYHILEGSTEAREGTLWKEGNLTIPSTLSGPDQHHTASSTKLWFRSGWKVRHETTTALNPRYLILVLNGHEPKLAQTAESWLQQIPAMPGLDAVTILLHGAESCRNDWFRLYLEDPKFKIRFVFVTYATDLVDNVQVFQWPLGVATYRGFPTPAAAAAATTAAASLSDSTSHLCNFFGTMYGNSSREELVQALKRDRTLATECLIRPRRDWLPKETAETREQYIAALQTSVLTLSPAGLNTECYRWLEAAAYGSTPVIEDVRKPATCGDPLDLVREAGAPFIYVSNWTTDVLPLLRRYGHLSATARQKRREKVLVWYREYRQRLKARFLAAIDRMLRDGGDRMVAPGVSDVS